MSERDSGTRAKKPLSRYFKLSAFRFLLKANQDQIARIYPCVCFLFRRDEVEGRSRRMNVLRVRSQQLNIALPRFDMPRHAATQLASRALDPDDLADNLGKHPRLFHVHSGISRRDVLHALSLRYPSFYITLRAVGVFGLAHGCEQ